MKDLTKEEYIQLLEDLAKQQYGLDPSEIETLEESNWTPSEPEIKKKLLSNPGLADLSATKKDKLKDLILDNKNIVVGPFRVRIKYSDYKDNSLFSISIWEENKQTKVSRKVDVQTDDRFESREWKKYFDSFKIGNNIPENDLIDIIRWLQAIHKLAAFL